MTLYYVSFVLKGLIKHINLGMLLLIYIVNTKHIFIGRVFNTYEITL